MEEPVLVGSNVGNAEGAVVGRDVFDASDGDDLSKAYSDTVVRTFATKFIFKFYSTLRSNSKK